MSQNGPPEKEPWLRALENFGDLVDQSLKKETARRAAMTPGQRVEDDEAQKREEASKRSAKAEKERQRLEKLYAEWWKHDTWDVDSEAIPLCLGFDPKTALPILPANGERIRELVKRADGVSLTLFAPTSLLAGKRVRPTEFVRFLMGKGESLPQQLQAKLAAPPVSVATGSDGNRVPAGRTAEANRTREENKRERRKALRDFKATTGKRAEARGTSLDWSNLPVTKSDFLKVFFRAYPGLAKKFGRATFENDFRDLEIRFKRGIKHQDNNMLDTIWRPVKEG
jgi:hypothetical protein